MTAGSCSLRLGVEGPGTGVEVAERLQIPGRAARPPGGRGVRKRNAKGAGVSEGRGRERGRHGPGADWGRTGGVGRGAGGRPWGAEDRAGRSRARRGARSRDKGPRGPGSPRATEPPAGAVR